MKKNAKAQGTRRNPASNGNGAQQTKHTKIRFIDLFAGIGGFRVALEGLDAKCVWSCEKDALAARWYLENHGDDPTGDITSVDAAQVPDHDILGAGFPCQPYSTQGKALGLADPRGRVFYAIPRILVAKQPAAFILENVDSLGHANNRWSHDRIVAALETAGYVVHETVLDAREFGLPQSRRRLFIVGFRRSLGTVPFCWPERGRLATNRDDFLDETPDRACYFGADTVADLLRASDLQRAKGNQWFIKFAQRTHVRALLSAPHRTQDNIILDPSDGSWRRLTPNEYRKLQGFPEGFTLPPEDRHAYSLLGNSVAVPVVRAVAECVVAALIGESPSCVQSARRTPKSSRIKKPIAAIASCTPGQECSTNSNGRTPASPLPYYGGKSRLAATIVKLFPPHKTYVEPFLGGGSVFFTKKPSAVEIINDLCGDLINFFRVVRNEKQRAQFNALHDLTPWSREEFGDCLEALNAGCWDSDVKRARMYLVAIRQGRGGIAVRRSNWSSSKTRSTGGMSGWTRTWMRLPERIAVAGLRLRAAQIECMPWQYVLDKYESEDTLVYLDPPYVHSTRTSGNTDSYPHEMTDVDHARLLLRVKKFRGKVVLSGYASRLYDEMLSGWHRIEIDTFSSASNKTKKKDAKRTEVLWLNYTPPAADAA